MNHYNTQSILLLGTILTFCMSTPASIYAEEYIAGKTSRVFHKTSCRWARKIKPENRIYFSAYEQAIHTGRRPCQTCLPGYRASPATRKESLPAKTEITPTPEALWEMAGSLLFVGAAIAVVSTIIANLSSKNAKEKQGSERVVAETSTDDPERAVDASPGFFTAKEFWEAFRRDLEQAKEEVIIVSPFVAKGRIDVLILDIEILTKQRVAVYIYIRPPEGDKSYLADKLRNTGARVFMLSGIHSKAAIIDRNITWIGSLNILQHWTSTEQMMRSEDTGVAEDLIRSLGKEHSEFQKHYT